MSQRGCLQQAIPPLTAAILAGNLELAQFLVSECADAVRVAPAGASLQIRGALAACTTPLGAAACTGSFAAVKMLLDAGAASSEEFVSLLVDSCRRVWRDGREVPRAEREAVSAGRAAAATHPPSFTVCAPDAVSARRRV